MTDILPTRGEIERNLSQSIQAFYRNQLSCRVGKISCHLLGNKLAIAIENSITSLEKLLNNSDDNQFSIDLRSRIDLIVKNELVDKIRKISGVDVIDLTINTTLEHNFTGVMVLLAEKPQIRNNTYSR